MIRYRVGGGGGDGGGVWLLRNEDDDDDDVWLGCEPDPRVYTPFRVLMTDRINEMRSKRSKRVAEVMLQIYQSRPMRRTRQERTPAKSGELETARVCKLF
jgi:hypothetical protein